MTKKTRKKVLDVQMAGRSLRRQIDDGLVYRPIYLLSYQRNGKIVQSYVHQVNRNFSIAHDNFKRVFVIVHNQTGRLVNVGRYKVFTEAVDMAAKLINMGVNWDVFTPINAPEELKTILGLSHAQ